MEGKVIFSDKRLKEAFEELEERDSKLYNHIKRALSEIKKNVFCGRNVKKSLIPISLIQKYGLNNLWIYNLPEGWRLLYSITSPDKIEVLAIILEWMNHKDYEKLFRF